MAPQERSGYDPTWQLTKLCGYRFHATSKRMSTHEATLLQLKKRHLIQAVQCPQREDHRPQAVWSSAASLLLRHRPSKKTQWSLFAAVHLFKAYLVLPVFGKQMRLSQNRGTSKLSKQHPKKGHQHSAKRHMSPGPPLPKPQMDHGHVTRT